MNAMTCNEVEEQIELFAAGECDPPTAAAIRRHMIGCARCTRAELEARQFLDMMDLRLQEPDRLQRLLHRIDAVASKDPVFLPLPRFGGEGQGEGVFEGQARGEGIPTHVIAPAPVRTMPTRSTARSSRQRWFAIAASILLPIGIGIWLTPPADSPKQDHASTRLAVALLPDHSAPGLEKLAPPAPANRSPAQSLTFALEPDIRSSKQYKAHLIETAQLAHHVPPPAVDLLLQIRNSTERTIRLRFDDPRTELRFSLNGPGVLRINAPPDTDPFASLRILDIAGGSSKDLPVQRLIGGSRIQPAYWYWTEPGDYHMRPVLRVPIESGGKTTMTTISGPAISIRVK